MKIGDKLKHNESGKCLHCGESVSLIGERYPLYCPGLVCKRAYEDTIRKRQPIRQIKCGFCGGDFTGIGIHRKYCSPECNYNADRRRTSKPPKPKKCKHCQIEFAPYNSLDKFCSANCRINNQKSKRSFNWRPDQVANRIGAKNPAYRNGMYTRSAKRTAVGNKVFFRNRDELKAKMIDDHGYLFCEQCKTGTTYQWETHHIIYRSEKPGHPHLHDKENLLHLCMQCHNDFHKSKDMRNAIVVERGLDKIFGQDVLDKMSAEERRERGLLTTTSSKHYTV